MWVAVGVSILSGIMASSAAKKQAQAQLNQAYMNKMLAELRSESIREAAMVEASRIRLSGKRLVKTQVAQQASSGVVVGLGSAEIANNEIEQLASADAMVVIYNGIKGQSSESSKSRFDFAAGRNASRASGQQATSSILGGVAGAFGIYNSSQQPNNTTTTNTSPLLNSK